MSAVISISTGKAYGISRVCRVWGLSRASVYRDLQPASTNATPRCRPGPQVTVRTHLFPPPHLRPFHFRLLLIPYAEIAQHREQSYGCRFAFWGLPFGSNRELYTWLSLRIVCMDVRWRLRGKPGVRRSPVQAVGTIAGSCRDIWSRRLGSAAGNPSTGCVGC